MWTNGFYTRCEFRIRNLHKFYYVIKKDIKRYNRKIYVLLEILKVYITNCLLLITIRLKRILLGIVFVLLKAIHQIEFE